MNSPLDSTAWLSTVLMFALVGTGVFQTSSRNVGRPPVAESLGQRPLYSQRISARLWEDPLEAARRAEDKTPTDDAANQRKWLASPTAFREQTQFDSRTRKLTALALREKWFDRVVNDAQADTLTKGKQSGADSVISDVLSCSSLSTEALEKALARQALFELQKRQRASKSDALYRQALALQRPPRAGLTESLPYLEATQEQFDKSIDESFHELLRSYVMTKPKILFAEDEEAMTHRKVLLAAEFDAQSYHSRQEEEFLVVAKDTAFRERFNRALARKMLNKLMPNKTSRLASAQECELTLEKILETPENRTLLLPIVVPEQMYPEVRELRLRMRYAVVSALAAADFNPESADELNLIPVPIYTNLASEQAGQVLLTEQEANRSWIPIPYEIFRRPKEGPLRAESDNYGHLDKSTSGGWKRPRQNGINGIDSSQQRDPTLRDQYWQVVVFWIDERITKTPSLFRKNLDAILDPLSPEKLSDVSFISTQGSETLTEIVATEEAFGKDTKDTFYFPFATVPKELLRRRVMDRIAGTSPPADREPIGRMRPIKRVQASDDYVIEMLLDELSLRLPSFGRQNGEICLFYETDSFYGRSMVDVFNRRYKDFTGRKDARVESIPYLKGVDGTLPVRRDESEPRLNLQDTTALVSAINKRVMQGNSGQWVLDQRQTDYIERQADRLKSSQGQIRAIGVFGTSVFDKIKVIEILRNEFRNVWFFTVDLDASLVNNDNPLATRNILIGSALDLSVEAGNIRSPEFRDSFQSAAFLSTLDALGLLGRDYEGEPGVWETSRVGFERLAFSGKPIWKVDSMCDEQACGNGPEKGQAWSWDMFLKTHFQAGGLKPARFLRPVLMILTVVFLVAVAKVIVEASRSANKPRWRREIVNEFEKVLPAGSYKRVVAGMFMVVFSLCLFGWLAQRVLGGFSEPFHWFHGVSIWPSLIIRGFATALGFYFFIQSFTHIDEAVHKMWGSQKGGVLLKGLEAARFPQENVESRYCSRLLILVVSFVLLQWVLFQMLGVAGGYFTPARGSMAFFAHEITILLSLAVFYLLVWSAVLRHLRCRELLNKLIQAKTAGEDQQVKQRAKTALPPGALSKPEILVLLDYNQAVVRSILYPFAMLVVLLASRHPVFDAWNFPVSLLISSSLILTVLVFCAFLLNESANKLAEDQKELFMPVSGATSSSKAIWESKELIGSFIPFWKQPVIQALTLAAAGVGLQWIQ